ncbi:MAG TPA: hemolysin family protein [Deltaproteobacteria bacterium]|nr:hemolysin family protein [Deltaproteobacteria bacterium]
MNRFSREIIIILLLIVVNGIFALAEVAVVASRKTRLRQLAKEGDAKAQAALELAESPNRFLSTVQVGITLIGVLAGAFGGATVSEEIAAYLRGVPAFSAHADSIGLGLVVFAITYLSLVVGELVPKRIALHNPERIASFIAAPMEWLSRLAAPIVALLSGSTDAVLRLIGLQSSPEPVITEQEITGMIEQGAVAGIFAPAEHTMVKRVFRLGDRTVGSIMTLRQDIMWLDLNDALEENLKKLSSSAYSRVPVCRGGLDNVVGILRAKDLLRRHLACAEPDIEGVMLEPVFVPESLRALRLLEKLKEERTHIVIVVDEYGSVKGLVTLNDILEAIVGELPSLDESDEPYAVRREDGSWLLDGMLPMDEFKELLGVGRLAEEETGRYLTLSGYVLTKMGRIPRAGDWFDADGLKFEIMDMDGNRIDKILVARLNGGRGGGQA